MNETSQIVATATPAGTSIIYTSSNPEIASVDTEGLITGVSEGSAIITVEAGGQRDTVNVTVSA